MPKSNMDVNPFAGSVSNASGSGFSPSTSMPFGAMGSAMSQFGNLASSAGNGLSSMATAGLTGGLGAAASLLSSGLNALFARNSARRQLRYEGVLMDKQNDMQRQLLADEMMLKLQGMKRAGLSTATLNGQFGGNVSQSMGSVGAPQASASDLGNHINAARLAALQARQVKLQEDAIESQIDLNRANAEKARSSADVDSQNAWLLWKYGPSKYEGEIRLLSANEKNLLVESEKKNQERLNSIAITEKEVQLLQQQYDINWKKLPVELKVLSATAYREYQQGRLSSKQVEVAQQTVYNLQRERDNIVRQGYISDLQADLLDAEIQRLANENQNLAPSALYNKVKEGLMNKFPWLVKVGVAADAVFGYVRQGAEIYSLVRGGSVSTTTTTSSGNGPQGSWNSTSTTTRK